MNDCKNLDDVALLHRLQLGDNVAYTEIYNRYWQKLFVVAAHKLKNLADAEEVVQDIFLEIWNRRETLIITSKLSSYLAAAVTYKVINMFAKRNVQLKYTEYAVENLPTADFSTINWLGFEELKDQLLKHVANLPEKCQLVFKLSREEGLSHKEIAEKLGISQKTVESHLAKATQLLKMNLTSNLVLLYVMDKVLDNIM